MACKKQEEMMAYGLWQGSRTCSFPPSLGYIGIGYKLFPSSFVPYAIGHTLLSVGLRA